MDATSKLKVQKKKTWLWPGHWVCGQEPAEKRRQGEGKPWKMMIKERMDERWEVSRQPRYRKRHNQDHRCQKLGSGPGSDSSLLCELG